MELEVLRFSSQEGSTLGILSDISGIRSFLCFTLEDPWHMAKIAGQTRIPAGRYEIGLRKEGGFNDRYSRRFEDIHIGMLWVMGVPDYRWILIHCGNTDEDTAGCLLVGDTSQQNITEDGFIGGSTAAYKRIYPRIAEAVGMGESVFINYVDENFLL